MTDVRKARTMQRKTERNAAICAYYAAGHKIRDCCSRFSLGRERVTQILRAGNVRQPYVKGDRTEFLGVNVSEETKGALRAAAEEAGISVSKFASDALDEKVR